MSKAFAALGALILSLSGTQAFAMTVQLAGVVSENGLLRYTYTISMAAGEALDVPPPIIDCCVGPAGFFEKPGANVIINDFFAYAGGLTVSDDRFAASTPDFQGFTPAANSQADPLYDQQGIPNISLTWTAGAFAAQTPLVFTVSALTWTAGQHLDTYHTATVADPYGAGRIVTPFLAVAIPETTSWVTMILGFGAVGIAMRRRRRADSRTPREQKLDDLSAKSWTTENAASPTPSKD